MCSSMQRWLNMLSFKRWDIMLHNKKKKVFSCDKYEVKLSSTKTFFTRTTFGLFDNICIQGTTLPSHDPIWIIWITWHDNHKWLHGLRFFFWNDGKQSESESILSEYETIYFGTENIIRSQFYIVQIYF